VFIKCVELDTGIYKIDPDLSYTNSLSRKKKASSDFQTFRKTKDFPI